jgi:hypothetical protein
MFGQLDSSDYARFVEDLFTSTVTANSPSFPHQQHLYDYSQSPPQRQQNMQQNNSNRGTPSPIGQLQQLKKRVEPLDIGRLMSIDGEELMSLAKNSNSTKQVQHHIPKSAELRDKFYAILTEPVTGPGALARLSTDSNGNFVVQVRLELGVVPGRTLVHSFF